MKEKERKKIRWKREEVMLYYEQKSKIGSKIKAEEK